MAPNVKDTDFEWTTETQYHEARKTQMLAKYGKEIRALMGPEPFTVYVAWIPVAVQLIAMLYVPKVESWALYFFLAWAIGGTANHSLFLLIHEVTHYMAFKEQWKNNWLAILVNFPIGVPYSMSFKMYHHDHHRNMGVDGHDADIPCPLEAALLSSFPGKLFFLFFQIFFYAIRPVFVKPLPKSTIITINWIVQMSFNAAVWIFFGFPAIFYLFLSSFMAGCFHPMAGHFIAEHYIHLFGNNSSQETYSYYGPLNILGWNVGYHNEHHDFPNIPWSRLYRLREIAPEFYEPLVKCESWPGTLWAFLWNPRVNLYSRIKRRPTTNNVIPDPDDEKKE